MSFSNDINDLFDKEYPVSRAIRVTKTELKVAKGSYEKIPHYIFLAIKAMKHGKNNPKPVCMVFPKKDVIAPTLATVLATERFHDEILPVTNLKNRTNQLSAFNLGDVIEINPGAKCYRYEGVESQVETRTLTKEDYVVLSVIGESSARRGFNLKSFDTSRIRKFTDKEVPKRMIGKLDDNCLKASPVRQGIDLILPDHYSLYNNRGLIKPCALLVSSTDESSEFLNNLAFKRKNGDIDVSLKESIGLSNGKLADLPHEAALIRIRNLEGLKEFIEESLKNSELQSESKNSPIIIDGLKHIRDFSNLHEIIFEMNDGEAQKRDVIVISEYGEIELISRYADQFKFWQVTHEELAQPSNTGNGLFGTIERVSKRYWSPDHTRIKIEDNRLESTVKLFLKIQSGLRNSPNDTSAVTVKQLWNVIQGLSQCAGSSSASIRENCMKTLEAAESDIEKFPHQYNHDLSDIKGAIECLKRFSQDPLMGQSKGIRLGNEIDAVSSAGETNIVILFRNKESAKCLTEIVNSRGKTVEVRSYDDLSDLRQGAVAVVPAWPGSKRIKKIIASGIFKKYVIIGYDHELAWAGYFFSKLHKFPKSDLFSTKDKLGLFSGEITSWPEWKAPAIEQKAEEIGAMAEAVEIVKKRYNFGPTRASDTLVNAHYCDLSGGHMAYLTEGFAGTVITIRGEDIKVREIPLQELDEDHILMFRGDSDHSIIPTLVDQSHSDARVIRQIAKIWEKEIQRKFASADLLHRSISFHGGKTTKTTAHNWYNGWLRISPEDKNLEIIAKALGPNSETQLKIHEIKEASDKLRAYHASAGNLITEMLKTNITNWRGDIGEDGATIDLPGLGKVNLVRIENISSSPTLVPRSKTNTLLIEQ